MGGLNALPWYGTVVFAGALAIISWFSGRYRRQRDEADTDASITGLGALKQIMDLMRSEQREQAQEIQRLRRELSAEVGQIGRLRGRVAHLEMLLRQSGITVPPDGEPLDGDAADHRRAGN